MFAHDVLPDGPLTVTAYQSMAFEPGTAPLIAALVSRGGRVLLPRIAGAELRWVPITRDTEFARGPLGIMEPVGPSLDPVPSPLARADVLFVPGLAVDRRGRRLGQGGGYYDKARADVPSHTNGGPLRVAVLFDDEVLDVVPSTEHDCVVDCVLTPAGVVTIDARTA